MNQELKILQNLGLHIAKIEIYKPGINKLVANQGLDYKYPNPDIMKKSMFGTPVFSDLKFGDITWDGKLYQHKSVNSIGDTQEGIDTCLFIVNMVKNIIKTDIQGREGSVKEYISLGDYKINVKGLCVGKNGEYPYDQVAVLNQYLKLPIAIPVTSWYLNNLFGITEIVIDGEPTFPQIEGGQSQQAFEFSALSDRPVELLIKDAK